MLHQWIQVAADLRGSLGDLYGFSAVMNGLQHPQVLHSFSHISHLYGKTRLVMAAVKLLLKTFDSEHSVELKLPIGDDSTEQCQCTEAIGKCL